MRRAAATIATAMAGIAMTGCSIAVLPSNVARWKEIAAAQGNADQTAMAEGDGVAAEPLVLYAADGFLVDATINGEPVRLRASLRGKGIQLTQAAASRAGLEPGSREYSMQLGAKRVEGRYATATVTIGAFQSTPRVEWFDADVGDGADGVVNVAYLPYPAVTLVQRYRTMDERRIVLPTEDRAGFAIVHPHRVGEWTIDVRPDLAASDTVLTTATGALLANRLGGRWTGEDRLHPIVHGIARPVRPMAFAQPLTIAGLRIDRAMVRLRDYQGKDLLPAYQTGEESEGAIEVTAKTDRSRAVHFLYLGRDVLGACSSITYTRATRELELTCPVWP